MLRVASWAAVCMTALACASPPRPTQTVDQRALPRTGMEIRYGVEAARPATSFALTIPPAGDAELLLLQPLASKPSPLGRFRGPIAPGTRAALERLVADHDLLDADQGEWATAEGSGSISLATPERRVLLGLASADPARNELRAKLDRVVDELTAHPVGAFRTELGAEPAPGGLVPILSLVHVGSEPLALVLVERDMVVSVVATVKPPNGPARELVLEPERVRELVAAGKLASGITQLSPGQHIDLPLGSAVEAGSHISVRGTCWYPGEGLSRRSVALLAEGDAR
jgi:hypothetical protein